MKERKTNSAGNMEACRQTEAAASNEDDRGDKPKQCEGELHTFHHPGNRMAAVMEPRGDFLFDSSIQEIQGLWRIEREWSCEPWVSNEEQSPEPHPSSLLLPFIWLMFNSVLFYL